MYMYMWVCIPGSWADYIWLCSDIHGSFVIIYTRPLRCPAVICTVGRTNVHAHPHAHLHATGDIQRETYTYKHTNNFARISK